MAGALADDDDDDDDDDEDEEDEEEKLEEEKLEGFLACEDCARRCFATHSNVNWCHGCTTASSRQRRHHADSNPSSCLVALTPPLLRSMVFPPSFAVRNLSKCVGEVKLEGPSGWVWPCSLEMENLENLENPENPKNLERGPGLFLKYLENPENLERGPGWFLKLAGRGWEEFGADHGLEEGDAILFTAVGRDVLKVRIFGLGSDGAEKGGGCVPRSVKALMMGAGPSDHHQPRSDDKRADKRAYDKRAYDKRAPGGGDKPEDQRSSASDMAIDDGDGGGDGCRGPCVNARGAVSLPAPDYVAGKGNLGALERARFVYETVARQMEHPSLTKLMNATAIRKHKLAFPATFVRSYMPTRNADIVLKDEAGKAWTCRWLGARNHVFVAAGWGPFVRAQGLQVGDVCIFELIDIEALDFKVHIFKG